MFYSMRMALSAVVLSPTILGLLASPICAQTFEDRWRIVPPANAAEPRPGAGSPREINEDQRPHKDRPVPGPSYSQSPALQQSRPINDQPARVLIGKASFYAYRRGKTASGALYDRNKMTAASRTLPLGTKLRVTDLKTNQSVDVIVTDRGPTSKHLILDLSLGAARALGIGSRGVIDVRAEVIG